MSDAATKNEPPAELPPPKKADKSKHFSFDHAVFQVKGAYFGFGKDGDTVCLHVPLGDIMAGVARQPRSEQVGHDRPRVAVPPMVVFSRGDARVLLDLHRRRRYRRRVGVRASARAGPPGPQ